MGQVLDEFNDIIKKKDDILLSVAIELRSALVKASPVDTGNLKSSWNPIEKTDDGYKIENTAIYATIALSERVVINGKQYGSEQFPQGYTALVIQYNEILQKKLEQI